MLRSCFHCFAGFFAVDVQCQRGLCVEPRNADLKKNLKEIDELIRGEKVRRPKTRQGCVITM